MSISAKSNEWNAAAVKYAEIQENWPGRMIGTSYMVFTHPQQDKYKVPALSTAEWNKRALARIESESFLEPSL